MTGFICGVLVGILVMNVGVLRLRYLASEQRRIRIEVDARHESASSSTRRTTLPITEV